MAHAPSRGSRARRTRLPSRAWLAVAVLAATAACGSDSTGPSPSHQSIAGTYQGTVVGLNQGIALAADFSLTITQTAGDLGGSWSLAGELTDGFDYVDILGTGTLSGSIGPGVNPSVTLTVRNACPNYQGVFSGSYDSTNGVITLTGPVDVLNQDCSIFLRYPSTVVLYR